MSNDLFLLCMDFIWHFNARTLIRNTEIAPLWIHFLWLNKPLIHLTLNFDEELSLFLSLLPASGSLLFGCLKIPWIRIIYLASGGRLPFPLLLLVIYEQLGFLPPLISSAIASKQKSRISQIDWNVPKTGFKIFSISSRWFLMKL